MAEPAKVVRPGDDVEIWTGPPSVGTRISYAAVRGLIWLVAKALGRVTVIGREKIPAEGAVPVSNPMGDVPAPYTQAQMDSVAATLTNPLSGDPAALGRNVSPKVVADWRSLRP